MTRTLLGAGAATAVITFLTFLPFLPGRYDSLAVTLSAMAWLLGRAGLLLVPCGALWMAAGPAGPLSGRRRGLAIATLAAASIVWLIVSLGALAFGGFLLAAIALASWAGALRSALPRLRAMRAAPPASTLHIALPLLVVPVAVALLQTVLAEPATELSRSRAIRDAGPMIADIEQYRAARGHYPPSLLAEWNDYRPAVIGIREFRYESSGEAYNLVFEQPVLQLDTREFVIYNPHDQQDMKSHDMDLLRLTPEELKLRQGWYAVLETPYPHWKRFRYD